MKLICVERLTAGPGWRPTADQLTAWAALVASLGGPDWSVELVWVEDDEMAALNARWRRHEGVTDVLSFSNLVDAGAGEPVLRAGEAGAAVDLWWEDGPEPPGRRAGEIVIAGRFVQRRCVERGWRFEDELALLVVHGVLHVLGWEHDTTARTAAMRNIERDLLAGGGREHPLLDAAGPEPA